MPLILGTGWAVFSGAIAICYVMVIARRPSYFLWLVMGQFVANFAASALGNLAVSHGWAHPARPETALTTFVIAAMVFVVLGYTFFLIFIQTEGRQTIRAHTELAMAHSIQQTLVPALHLRAAGCEIFGISVPSDKVGGDVVDALTLADGGMAAYVADVAGHGLQAGILMGMVKTAARTRLLDESSLARLFDSLNRVMPEVKEAHMYATCAALRIPPTGTNWVREVEFGVAGHPAILRIQATTGKADYHFDEQLPLGLFPHADYRSKSMFCVPGDLLVVATDGILEAEGPNGEEFGVVRLEETVRREQARDLPDLAETILRAVNGFGKQTDDQTLLLIRVL